MDTQGKTHVYKILCNIKVAFQAFRIYCEVAMQGRDGGAEDGEQGGTGNTAVKDSCLHCAARGNGILCT